MMLALREPQRERKKLNRFQPLPVRLELCRKMNGYFSDLQGLWRSAWILSLRIL